MINVHTDTLNHTRGSTRAAPNVGQRRNGTRIARSHPRDLAGDLGVPGPSASIAPAWSLLLRTRGPGRRVRSHLATPTGPTHRMTSAFCLSCSTAGAKFLSAHACAADAHATQRCTPTSRRRAAKGRRFTPRSLSHNSHSLHQSACRPSLHSAMGSTDLYSHPVGPPPGSSLPHSLASCALRRRSR